MKTLIAKDYDEVYKKEAIYHAHYRTLPFYRIMQHVVKHVKAIEEPKVLEIGSGAGQMGHYLYDKGVRNYHGFDFSREAVAIATKLTPQHFFVGDALDPKCYKHDYNVAILLEVLEHIKNDFAVINNIKQGATVIFSVPRFMCEGHIRAFPLQTDILNRYFNLLKVDICLNLRYYPEWFFCKGVRR